MMNRRTFLQHGAVALVAACSRSLFADPLGLPLGCQTYPVRKEIAADFPGTMKTLSVAGFTNIELCSPYGYKDFAGLQQYKPQELRRILSDWGLTCISAHWAPTELFEKADVSIAYAHDFGMTQMAVAALGPFQPKGTETADDVKRYVEPFNAIEVYTEQQRGYLQRVPVSAVVPGNTIQHHIHVLHPICPATK